jgi:hypothetical protein
MGRWNKTRERERERIERHLMWVGPGIEWEREKEWGIEFVMAVCVRVYVAGNLDVVGRDFTFLINKFNRTFRLRSIHR